MDIQEIKNIVEIMKRSDLSEFEIQEKEFKLKIKRGGSADQPATIIAAPTAAPAAAAAPVAAPTAAAPAAASASADDGLEVITSPMVGTFYRSQSPDSPAYVEKGASVDPDSVVCIIEAMKVMNEIQADIKGTVVEILVENEQSVEFGQPLFKIKPS